MPVEDFKLILEQLDSHRDNIRKLIQKNKFNSAGEELATLKMLIEKLQSLMSSDIQKKIATNRKLDFEVLYEQVQAGLEKRDKGKREDGNLAFKCNWNDKSYKGVCTDTAYQYNLSHGRAWCSVSNCRQFTNMIDIPIECCYESRALIDVSFAAGWHHDAQGNLIRPFHITGAKKGKVGLLTTEPPGKPRLIVAAFLISKVVDDPGQETWVYGDKETVIDDILQYEISFWKHYKNPRKPESTSWAMGLFRYISDKTAYWILEDYISKASNPIYLSRAKHLIRATRP